MFALPELFGSPYILPAIIAVVILLLLLLLLSMRSRRRGGSSKKTRRTATERVTAKRSSGASSPATAGAGSGAPSVTRSTSPLPHSAGVTPTSSGDPVAAVVNSIVRGWGNLTNEDTNRLKIFRPEKVIAAIAAMELPKDLKSAEHARARLNQLRHYASSLEQSLPAAGTPQLGAEAEAQPAGTAKLQTEPGPGQPFESQTEAPAEPWADLEPKTAPVTPPVAQESAASSEPAGEGSATVNVTWAEASEQIPDLDKTAETAVDVGDLWDVDENTTAWGAGTAAAAAVGAKALEEAGANGEEEWAEADALVDDQLNVVEETAVEEVPLLDEAPFVEEIPLLDEAPFVEEVPFVDEVPLLDKVPFVEEIAGGRAATNAAAAMEAAEETGATATDEATEFGEEAGSNDFFSSLQGKVSTADDLLALPAEERAGMLAFLQPAELSKVFQATSDVALKKSVIDTLGDIGNTDSLGVLRECLDDSDPQIQVYALDAADRLLGAS